MSKKKELKRIREKINELDAELLKLINQRSSLAIEAGKAKEDEAVSYTHLTLPTILLV